MNNHNNQNNQNNSINPRPRSPSFEYDEYNDDDEYNHENDNDNGSDYYSDVSQYTSPIQNVSSLQNNQLCANIRIDTGVNRPVELLRHVSTERHWFFSDLLEKYVLQLSREDPLMSIPSNRLERHTYSPHDFEIIIEGRDNPVYIGNGENDNDFTDDMMKNVLIDPELIRGGCVFITLKKSTLNNRTGGGRRKTRKSRSLSKKMNKNKTNKTNKRYVCKNRSKGNKFPKRIHLYSTPKTAQKMAHKYLGKTAKLYPALNPEKKYSICDPKNRKWVNFGQMGYEDFTKHHDKKRRHNYLTRTKYMLGDWKRNPYSANNLSRKVLW